MSMNFNGLSAEVNISGNISTIPVIQSPAEIKNAVSFPSAGVDTVMYTCPASKVAYLIAITGYSGSNSSVNIKYYDGSYHSLLYHQVLANTGFSITPITAIKKIVAGEKFSVAFSASGACSMLIIEEDA